MKQVWKAMAVLAVLWVQAGTLAVAATPLEVLGGLPTLENLALSPDGSKVAFVSTHDQDQRTLAIVSLANDKVLNRVELGDKKLRALSWADDEHLLIETSQATAPMGLMSDLIEWSQLLTYDLGRKQFQSIPDAALLFREVRVLQTISSAPMVRHIEGHTVVFVQSPVVGRGIGLFRADLNTGLQRDMHDGGWTTHWLVDASGEIAARSDYHESDRSWQLQVAHEGHLRTVTLRKEPIDVPQVLGFGPSLDTVLMSTMEDGVPRWRLVSRIDGSIGEPLAEHRGLESPFHDPATHRLIGGVTTDDVAQYVFFDPAMQKHWEAILRAYPDEHVSLLSASADFQKLIVLVDGARDGYGYRLVDLTTHRAESLGDVYKALTTNLMKKRVTYKAADGLDIPAYLTLPRGKEPKALAVVVLVHGGPADRDTAEFDWWSQALATQGYAVLQPNYRGSTVDSSFMAAGYGQFGRKMQTDVSDGVRYLVKEGIADPARVCIVGASYGGYAALAGATLDTGVYRCAESIAGISDIRSMLYREGRGEMVYGVAVRYWDRFMGVKGPRDPVVDAISPIKHIDAVRIPVLLIHGKDDTVVPYEQSLMIYDAMRHAGKPVEMVTLAHEDHWLSRSQTRRQMLETSVAFLRKHNPPD
jgi:dipeptidyl aminopeptidase/acylaminoacyl peptidase